jgi:GGDEF domain-containing protein
MFYHLAARYGGEEFVLLLWDILCTVISYEGWTEFMALQRFTGPSTAKLVELIT